MRHFVVRSLAIAMTIWAMLPAAASADRADDEAQISGIKRVSWPQFYREQNVDGLAEFLAPTFVMIAPDGSITPRDRELDAVRTTAWAPDNFTYTIDRIVWLDDDRALVVGRGTSDRTDAERKPCRHSYASSNLLQRAPEAPLGWRALFSHVSGVVCTPVGKAGAVKP
jgi:hypothetical protein